MTKVLLVSSSYPMDRQDWRGRFIADMTEALSRQKELQLSIWAPDGERSPLVENAATSSESEWLNQLVSQGGIAHVLRTKGILGLGTAFTLLRYLRKTYRRNENTTDVAHVNWLQNALPLWRTSTPVLIGVLGSDFALLRIPGMKMLLRAVLRQRRCILAPNAGWMVPALQKSFGDVAQVMAIPFGIEKSWFSLTRNPLANEVPQWLVVSRLTRNKIGDLLAWGEPLFGPQRNLHLLGPMQEEIALPDWVQYHGPTNPAELQQKWFPMATGLVTLSRHDEGRPQVMLEAMAAGLPVIASDLPAHRDLICHQKTGWLATSPSSFQEGLTYLENADNNQHIGASAKAWVTEHVGTWDDCAQRYHHAYRTLLEPGQ